MSSITELWGKYESAMSEYKNKPIPEYIPYDSVLEEADCKKARYLREKISQHNSNVSWINYVMETQEKIFYVLGLLEKEFGFSIKELKNNISVYDPIFQLTDKVLRERVSFFIDLLDSKRNFLIAMHTGTPLENVEFQNKAFKGIMSYKNYRLFEEKINVIISVLSLNKNDAIKIFISSTYCMYCSSETIKERLLMLSDYFSVSQKKLGEILTQHPCLISITLSKFEKCRWTLAESFSLTDEQAKTVIISYPEILNNMDEALEKLILEKAKDIPKIILEKPGLYVIRQEIVEKRNRFICKSFEQILELFEQIEISVGKIINVYCKKIIQEEQQTEILHSVLRVQSKENLNLFYFISVSFGGDYSPENQLLRSIFGEKCPVGGFMVEAPNISSIKYAESMSNVFMLCSKYEAAYVDDLPTFASLPFANKNFELKLINTLPDKSAIESNTPLKYN